MIGRTLRGTVSALAAAFVLAAPALAEEVIMQDPGGAYGEALARGKAVRLSLDQTMVADESAPLADGAEVAFFPPVTGG